MILPLGLLGYCERNKQHQRVLCNEFRILPNAARKKEIQIISQKQLILNQHSINHIIQKNSKNF